MAELNNLGRIPTRPLSYIDKDKAVEKEVVVDYETSKIYVSDETKVLHDVFEENIDRSLNARKGVAGGIPELDSAGKIPANQLPSFVDDVLELPTMGDFPVIGESGKIYIAVDTNKSYRWGGTVYVAITSGVVIGETENSAYRGDRGAAAYAHSITTGNSHGMTKSDIGLGNVPNVDTNDQTPTFTEAETVSNINSGEKISTIFGKIKKLFNHIMTKKADLGEDGKLLPTQLPSIQNSQVVSQAEAPVSDDTVIWIDTDENYGGYDLDGALAGKADLGEDGKVLKSQLNLTASDVGAVPSTGGDINGDINMQFHNIKNIDVLYGKPMTVEMFGHSVPIEKVSILSSNPETPAVLETMAIFSTKIFSEEGLTISKANAGINIGEKSGLYSNLLTLFDMDKNIGFKLLLSNWDDVASSPRVELIGQRSEGDTTIDMNVVLGGIAEPIESQDAANRRYVDINIERKLYERIRLVPNKGVATSEWVYNASLGDFPYYANIYLPRMDSTYRADVIFNREDALSGNFSMFTETGKDEGAELGYVTIYCKVQPVADILIDNILLIMQDMTPI